MLREVPTVFALILAISGVIASATSSTGSWGGVVRGPEGAPVERVIVKLQPHPRRGIEFVDLYIG